MAKLEVINTKELKALQFKEGRKYAFISFTTQEASDIGYISVKLVEGQREYWYKGIKTGTYEMCHPCSNSRFLEVKLCT